jgi:hypothetical protein
MWGGVILTLAVVIYLGYLQYLKMRRRRARYRRRAHRATRHPTDRAGERRPSHNHGS